MKSIPQRPRTEPTEEMPEKIADTPAVVIQSTRGRIWRALENIGLLAYKAPRLPDPERESAQIALAHTEKSIKILPEIKDTLWHIYDDLEKIANPKFSELREGHRPWIEKYVTKNINDTFLVHTKALQIQEESIRAFSSNMESSATLPKIISRLAEIRRHLESIIEYATEIQNPWEAPSGIEEAISAMEHGHREACSDYLLAEHENIEQGGTKRKKSHQEKGPQDITPIKRAHMVQERRILTKKDTMSLFDKFFPPWASLLIQASSWVCLAAKPRDAKFAFDNEYIPTLKEEMQVLQIKIQGMKAPLTDRAITAAAEAQKLFDAEKERYEVAEKEGKKTEWELIVVRAETKNAKAHVASILSQYEALTAKRPQDGIDELGFDLAGLLPDGWDSTKEVANIDEVNLESPVNQQEAKEAKNIMEQAEVQSEIAIQNEERKLLDNTQAKAKIADIKIAMEKAGENLRQKEAFLAGISGTIAAIEMSKAIAEKSTRKKRLYYWLPGTTIALVAALLGQHLSEISQKPGEWAQKKENMPAVVPRPAPNPTPIKAPVALVKKADSILEQPVSENPLSAEQLPTEVITVLFSAGYDEKDDNFMEITDVIVEVLGDALLETPSQNKRKEIIESVLKRNFHLDSVRARKELRQYFSIGMQNGTLAIAFTPEISDEIFQEIEKFWLKLTQEQRRVVLEKVLFRERRDTKPQKTKQEVVNELIATMEVITHK